jgi:transposase
LGLNSKIKAKLPEKGIMVRRSGPYSTVFKTLGVYRNAKGQPTNDRVTIGKLDESTGLLVPNENYFLHYPEQEIIIEPTYARNRSIGMSFLADRLASSLGINEPLVESFGKTRSKLILTAALHILARGNVFEDVLRYCEGFTLNEPPLTSRKASELFKSITHGERMAFFKSWFAKQPPESYLAYDVTSFPTYAKGIVDAEYGHNRDGERLPRINLVCYLSRTSGIPVFYATYPGSINDKSHLSRMMSCNKELGIKNVGFVLDRGFCSTNNIKHMTTNGLEFVMGVETRHKTIKDAPDEVHDEILSMSNDTSQGVFAMAKPGCYHGSTTTLHIYHDLAPAKDHFDDWRRNIQEMEERLSGKKQLTKAELGRYRTMFIIHESPDGSFAFERDIEKLNKPTKYFGYFCFLTNTNLEGSDTLEVCRRKDTMEKGFDDIKNHLEMSGLRTHKTATTDGKLFCAFIALILTTDIRTKLGELMKKKRWCEKMLISELEKIRALEIIGSGGRYKQENPLTKTQRMIFEHFGLIEDDLTTYIEKA